MSISAVSAGKDVPESVNVVIEIPMNSSFVKYEVDHDSGVLSVDRFFTAPMFYPANYGFIPQTLGLDGDPLDVLVVTPHPLLPGSVIECRPIGMLLMEDDGGQDPKLLALPAASVWPECAEIDSLDGMSEQLLTQIEHFFKHYKDLDCGKWTKTSGWTSAEDAKSEIKASIQRFAQNGGAA